MYQKEYSNTNRLHFYEQTWENHKNMYLVTGLYDHNMILIARKLTKKDWLGL